MIDFASAPPVAIGQLLDLLRLDLNARRVGAEVDLVPDIVQVPEGVPVLADHDGLEIGLVLQRCEYGPAFDQVGEIVFVQQIACYDGDHSLMLGQYRVQMRWQMSLR